MYCVINKKRLLIIISLLILEIMFISLAIRSYGNKYVEDSMSVMGVDNNKWPGENYILSEDSGCLSSSGLKSDSDLKYSNVEDKIVFKLDGSANCYFYFEEK